MTTSDDDLQPGTLDDEGVGSAPPAEPYDEMTGELEPPVARPSAGRLVLAIVASVAVATAGVVLWASIYAIREREYIGIAVLVGLLVGYLMRAISGRSTIPVRVVASLITVVACVCGTVVGEVAYVSAHYDSPFWDLLDKAEPKWWATLRHRNALTFVVYAAAVIIAFLAAGPQKPKKVKTPPVDEDVEAPGDDATEDVTDDVEDDAPEDEQ